MSENRIPVIIDCDPGIDDAIALMAAFAQPNLNVLAVCSVAGNVGIEKTTANARTVISVLGVKCPIYRGAECALMPAKQKVEAPEVHGKFGIGNFSILESQYAPLEQEHAVNAEYRMIMASAEPVTIIAVGPLTNIAILLRLYPQVKTNIKQISLMGGGLYSGNHTAAAEFNVLADPEAAEIVFQSGIPIIMAGLDVTHKATVNYSDYRAFCDMGTSVGNMIAKALSFIFEHGDEAQWQKNRGCMHDSVSVLAVAKPELVSGKNLFVAVETAGVYSRGYTVADLRTRPGPNEELKKPNCNVLFDINRDAFIAELMRCAKSYG